MTQTTQQPPRNFPLVSIIIRNLFDVLCYALAVWLLHDFGIWVVGIYIAFSIAMIVISWRDRCTFCCYYGTLCPSGAGWFAAKFFERGDPKDQAEAGKSLSFTSLIWSLPVIGGSVMVVLDFTYFNLAMLALFFILRFGISERIAVSLGCRKCQAKSDCAAYQAKYVKKQDQ